VVARRQALLDSVVERITRAGWDARARATDLSDLAAVDELIAKVEQDLGGVDILITNAGKSIRRRSPSRWTAGTTSSGPWL